MSRAVLHCDLNNFFASVACHDDPSLIGKAVAVGGSTEDRHGIILAKNELAKRYHVQTGEALWQAREKCPNLIIVPPNFQRYQEFSLGAKEIYRQYSDCVEPFGLDECWVDVSGSRSLFGSEAKIAEEIRARMKKEIGLTISVGVSFNKVFAKIGSDLKKPDAVTVIDNDHYKEILWPMPVNTILGVGPATTRTLRQIGVYTLGDLAHSSPAALKRVLGKIGIDLWQHANGNDASCVSLQDAYVPPQSVGRSVTCREDLRTREAVARVILSLSEAVATELRLHRVAATGVCLHLRDCDLSVTEYQQRLSRPTQLASVLAQEGMALFDQNFDKDKPLRSVGIRAFNLKSEEIQYQLNIFDPYEKDIQLEKIERSMDAIRERFGKESIQRASLLKKETSPMPVVAFRACFNHFVSD